ncbi:MAG: 50S ribosomal protein L23 [Holosporaceae bacterium]|jgi:large subunit ribosomal protein L23|nr:50S ribosomal protein L23 [Holosporaceae bacterium]
MISEYDCLIAPVMTEKVMNAGKDGIYVFKVHSEATKLDVCKAVEKVFSVKVSKVNMLNRDGKRKKFRGKDGLTKPRKLAIVRLADGSINFEDGI